MANRPTTEQRLKGVRILLDFAVKVAQGELDFMAVEQNIIDLPPTGTGYTRCKAGSDITLLLRKPDAQ